MTLSGTISASSLNSHFSGKFTDLNASPTNKDFQYDIEVFDLASSLGVGLRTLDFTVPDDLELRVVGMTLYSASAVPTATLTLTAIDIDQNSASAYLLDQTISISKQAVVGSTSATRDDRQASTTTKIFLKKGITYRIQLSSNSATVIDRVHAFVYARARKRRS